MKTHESRSRNHQGGAIVAILVLLLVVVLFYKWPEIARKIGDVYSGASRLGHIVRQNFWNMPGYFYDNEALRSENEYLRSEFDTLVVDKLSYETFRSENDKLREELKFAPGDTFLGASIISYPPQTFADTILINRGLESGLSEGDTVLFGESIYLGRVEKLFNKSGVVRLGTVAGNTIRATIDRTGAELEIRGSGNYSYVSEVPLDFDIEINDRITQRASRLMIVGVVVAVNDNESQGTRGVFIKWPMDIRNNNTVFILKN